MIDVMDDIKIRRTDTETMQAGDYYDGVKRYYDHNMERTVIKIMTGDCYVTNQPDEMLVTILGSCISVCMRDPETGIGGMNHFLLPGKMNTGLGKYDPGYSTRFGAFAMEELINGILKLGGRKDRLEVKVFGGGNVIYNSAKIGSRNAIFVREFLKNEGFSIISQDLEGDYPRRIHYFPETGKVMMRKLKRKEDLRIINEEQEFEQIILQKKKPTIELF